ncbi:hexitol phosphatase HxpB [Marinomonas sp. 2405UD66-6]|uniref:hexitol phosphatase HxpB n=1 Tax=Marinomonas sp. 2405UD66-6 TaxID=3391834 RepID=UPI0039C98240
MIEAVIFDMDGTLIDSEPMWKEAERFVFSSLGVDVTDELSFQTASMTTREVTEFWYNLFPWTGRSLEQVENDVVDRVATLITTEGMAMEGVKTALDFCQSKALKIGLATNAPARLIPVILEKLDIAHYFHAVSSSEYEIQGKPDPAVYLSTVKKLNVEPSACIAIEDSVSGVMAAINANLKTVVVPPVAEYSDEKYDIADIKLKQLSELPDVLQSN